MTNTTNLALPNIEGAQAQKHVTHNDALRTLDALVQLAVLDRDLSAPPGSPAEGARWIVKPAGSGAWAGHDNAIAAWQDGAWEFYAPQTGWRAFVADEGALVVWNGSAWTAAGGGMTLIASGTVSNAATLDIDLTGAGAYRAVQIVLDGLLPVADGVSLLMRVSTNGGTVFDSGVSDYKYANNSENSASTSVNAGTSTADSSMNMGGGIGNDIDGGVDGIIWLQGFANPAAKPKARWQMQIRRSDDELGNQTGAGMRNAAQHTDAIRILFSSGNIASGNYAIYGVN
ncbi:MAG TPA: DUF2793 domain-containing protein [Pseudolabrys sp.]|nr:DUF2793 domain-containing protein [Pseudolabrys sp.]